MIRWQRWALASSLLLAPFGGSDPECFLPDGYSVLIRLSVKELRTAPFWPVLTASPIVQAALARANERLGLATDAVDSVLLAGTDADWNGLACVLRGDRLDIGRIAAHLVGEERRDETIEDLTLLVPARDPRRPALLGLDKGTLILGAPERLRRGLRASGPAPAASLLQSVMPAWDSTLAVATSHDQALADVGRFVPALGTTELAAASVAVNLTPKMTVEARIRTLEQAAAAPLAQRLGAALRTAERDAQRAGRKNLARVLGAAEIVQNGAEIRIAVELDAEVTSATGLVLELLPGASATNAGATRNDVPSVRKELRPDAGEPPREGEQERAQPRALR